MSKILCQQPSMDSSNINAVEAATMKLNLVPPESYKSIDDYFKTDPNSKLRTPKPLKLSQKSLDLCTECLGNETGCVMFDNDDMFTVPLSSLSVTKSRRDNMKSKKVVSRSFPPPLTTMAGPKLFQLSPRRETGRLIIELVETNMGKGCFLTKRGDGRLRLTLEK